MNVSREGFCELALCVGGGWGAREGEGGERRKKEGESQCSTLFIIYLFVYFASLL